jgi:hypothetical protein
MRVSQGPRRDMHAVLMPPAQATVRFLVHLYCASRRCRLQLALHRASLHVGSFAAAQAPCALRCARLPQNVVERTNTQGRWGVATVGMGALPLFTTPLHPPPTGPILSCRARSFGRPLSLVWADLVVRAFCSPTCARTITIYCQQLPCPYSHTGRWLALAHCSPPRFRWGA